MSSRMHSYRSAGQAYIRKPMASTSSDALRTALAKALPAIPIEPPTRIELSDATEAHGLTGHADALALPRSAEEVAAVLAWCYEHDVPLTPRGGGTGFAGGAVPLDGGVVLDLRHLNRVRSLEPRAVAGGGRGRRDDGCAAAPRARERTAVSTGPRRRRAVADRRQHRDQRRRPAHLQVRRDRRVGDGAGGRAGAGRGRAARRRRAQGRRRL